MCTDACVLLGEQSQQIQLLKGTAGHCGAGAHLLETFSHSHNFSSCTFPRSLELESATHVAALNSTSKGALTCLCCGPLERTMIEFSLKSYGVTNLT